MSTGAISFLSQLSTQACEPTQLHVCRFRLEPRMSFGLFTGHMPTLPLPRPKPLSQAEEYEASLEVGVLLGTLESLAPRNADIRMRTLAQESNPHLRPEVCCVTALFTGAAHALHHT